MIGGPFAASDDELHPPGDPDDPDWTETCWFTFTVPERRLSGQLYPFLKPTLGVAAAAVYFWDDTGDQVWSCRYARSFWHLPLPERPLSDLALGNGARYRVLEPGRRYAVAYDDPDGHDVHVDLTFTGITEPHRLADSHVDQPGRVTGRVVLDGEVIDVDAYGFRDRSWGHRTQHGAGIHGTESRRGGYSYATADDAEGFHAITMDFGDGTAVVIHGHLRSGGVWAPLVTGHREVVARDEATGAPTHVRLSATDDRGRKLRAEGRTLNRFGVLLNPNLWTWNCLTEWTWGSRTGFGEDHDNWSASGQRAFARDRRTRR